MILYHGTSRPLETIKKHQAQQGEGLEVPDDELMNAIYLTPDLGFAIACAARPFGATHIDDDARTIEFENPDLFDPNKEIYVYEVDADAIPAEHIRQIDSRQYVITGLDEIRPDSFHSFKGEDVLKYYELKNWKKPEKESGLEMKMK